MGHAINTDIKLSSYTASFLEIWSEDILVPRCVHSLHCLTHGIFITMDSRQLAQHEVSYGVSCCQTSEYII